MRLLDTNVLAKWGNPSEQHEVVPYLQTHADEEFVTSSLVLYEFFRPVGRRSRSRQVRSWLGRALDGVESFTESASLKAASVEADLRRRDATVGTRDLLVAAHAADLGATFVTIEEDLRADPVQELLDVDVITP